MLIKQKNSSSGGYYIIIKEVGQNKEKSVTSITKTHQNEGLEGLGKGGVLSNREVKEAPLRG